MSDDLQLSPGSDWLRAGPAVVVEVLGAGSRSEEGGRSSAVGGVAGEP